MVMLEDAETADPMIAERNAAKGLDRYVVQHQDDGSYRLLSYEVIDSEEAARRSVAPRERTQTNSNLTRGVVAPSPSYVRGAPFTRPPETETRRPQAPGQRHPNQRA